MSKKDQKKYFRLTKAERASIERGLDGRASARGIAKGLGRSPSAITAEILKNVTFRKRSTYRIIQ